MMGGIFSHTEMGKALDKVAKVARDLIKARRESGHTEKVSIIVAGSGVCIYAGIIMECFLSR